MGAERCTETQPGRGKNAHSRHARRAVYIGYEEMRLEAVKNRLAGESACPTRLQALRQQGGTDAFVCQAGHPPDFFTASWPLIALRSGVLNIL